LNPSVHALIAATLVALAVAATAAEKTLYKAVGPDGQIIYSDKPPTQGRVEKTMKFENLPATPLPVARSAYLEWLKTRPSTAAAPPAGDVHLFSAAWCGYCRRAKAWLGAKGVAYREFDVDTNAGMAAYAAAGGGKGVPLLVKGGQRVQGFAEAAYEAAFAPPR
jgi:glutaredoxin